MHWLTASARCAIGTDGLQWIVFRAMGRETALPVRRLELRRLHPF